MEDKEDKVISYKIGLLSTHGTGKTTLAYEIAAELKKKNYSVRVIGEIATIARERAMPIDKITTLEAQAWILHRQCSTELEAMIAKWEVIICDRTVLDNYCYLENKVGANQYYREIALRHHEVHPYQRLFYLPVVGKFSTKKRDPDRKFQRAIDQRIVNFLSEQGINYITLPPERRTWKSLVVQQTLKDLNDLKEKKEQEHRAGGNKWTKYLLNKAEQS